MFDVGFWEVTLIAVVALLVVGPERLPALARTVGLYIGKARRYADHVRREIEREVPTREIREAIRNPPKPIAEIKESLEDAKTSLSEAERDLTDVQKTLREPVAESGQEAAGAATEPTGQPSATDARDAPKIESNR